MTILDFGVSEAVVAGDILAHLARRGELIGVEDVLIGATALVREYTVVTGNVRHFARIPALQVERWVSGAAKSRSEGRAKAVGGRRRVEVRRV